MYNQVLERRCSIQILKKTEISQDEICPYFPDRRSRNKFMLATEITREEFGYLLESGWRRFGIYFFRPCCDGCSLCIPIRIPVNEFSPSKGQKRVTRKNADTEVILRELSYSDEIYEVYKDHSSKFGQITERENFIQTFFLGSAPAYQTEYYVNGELAGVGFLDSGDEGLSSVYFVYRLKYSSLSLGTFSVTKEIDIARDLGMKHYYLGYYIKDNKHMNYKADFKPHQLYDWKKRLWNNCKTVLKQSSTK